MLSFATEFPVRDCDQRAFIECVTAWLEGSPHTTLPKRGLRDVPETGRWELRTEGERLEALLSTRDSRSIVGFKHVKSDSGIEWTTTVVFFSDEEGCWVSVRTSREANKAQLGLPRAKKPFIVKTLLGELGGGLDGELYVSGTPHNFGPADVGKATRLLNGDADNYLPVVYISRGFDERILFDPLPLARDLGGLAHVVVEPSRQFSRKLQPDVNSRNVYGGRAGVYWPNGEFYHYLLEDYGGSEFDARRVISGRIRDALVHRRPLARCTWARAEAEVARDAFDALRKAGSANVEEYIREFDAEIHAKNKQLEDAEDEIRRLKAQVRPYWGDSNKVGLQLRPGSEREFVDGEFAEIMREALSHAANNVQHDSRREHILRAIVASLPDTEPLKARRERLKETLRQYTNMAGDAAKMLGELGFEIADDGKHYKLTYMGDDRYVFALPKSGSDHRGGLNAASDIGKRVF